MTDIDELIKEIDYFLDLRSQNYTTPPEINEYLYEKGFLNNYDRSGSKIRDLLRKGKISHAYKVKDRFWRIPHS